MSKQLQQQSVVSASSPSPRLSRSRRTSSNQDGGSQANSGQMTLGSSNLLAVERDGRISEGAASQDKPSTGSMNTDEKSSKSDAVVAGSLGNIGSSRIIERNSVDEMRDQIVMAAAKETATESSGCTVS